MHFARRKMGETTHFCLLLQFRGICNVHIAGEPSAAVSTLRNFRVSSPAQLLRQAANLWPYAFIGISFAGLVYLYWLRSL
jgi:hypothetical protein